VTSVLFTYPLEVARVRLAFETQNKERVHIRALFSKIYHERDRPILSNPQTTHQQLEAFSVAHMRIQHSAFQGIANFYRGFIPTIVGMIPYAGVSFWAHDWAGDILRSERFARYTLSPVLPRNEREARHPKLKHQWEAIAGAAAGILAQTASYPIEIVRRRMQVGGAIGNREMMTFGETVKDIYSTGGLRGFYIGLSIGYIKACSLLGIIRESLILGYSNGLVFICSLGAAEALVRPELDSMFACFIFSHV
jgi:solute carrier family 25 (mitochondrial carrier protein), member 16